MLLTDTFVKYNKTWIISKKVLKKKIYKIEAKIWQTKLLCLIALKVYKAFSQFLEQMVCSVTLAMNQTLNGTAASGSVVKVTNIHIQDGWKSDFS